MHYYYIEIFLVAIDAILAELNNRFNEISLELLVCMAAFNLRNSISNFDVDKFVRLAEIYAEDFDIGHLYIFPINLDSLSPMLEELQIFLDALNLKKLLSRLTILTNWFIVSLS
jgi:hypothetical protein